MTNYLSKSISEIHSLLVEKKTTPLELVNESIDKIKNDKTNCMEATCFDKAIDEAKKIGEIKEDEILKGIPYLAKDNYSTKGVETTASSNILNGYIPNFDATVVKKLRKSGMIMVGHTSMDELAMGGTGTSGKRGNTLNPYCKDRIIGGSSSGSAASVSTGLVPFALGSDTGDSVRKPASNVNLVGFKPTWGLISRFGLFPFAPSLDTVAYFTRNVFDSAVILSTLCGKDKNDFSSANFKRKKYETLLNDCSLHRVGYFKAVYDNINDIKIKKEFDTLLSKLKDSGFSIVQYDYPIELLDALYPTYMIISCSEASSNDANLDGIRFGPKPSGDIKTYADYMKKSRTEGFSSLIKRRFVIGSFSLLQENRFEMFDRAQKARRLIIDEMNKFYETCDFLISPASFSKPKLFTELSTKWKSNPDFMDNILTIGNFGGFPSITLPFMKLDESPLGINITGRCFQDDKVLSFANAIENITQLKNITKEVQ